MGLSPEQAAPRLGSLSGEDQTWRDRANLRNKSRPRPQRVESSTRIGDAEVAIAAFGKTFPGIMSRLFLIASATNSVPVPHGARGNA